MMRFLYLWKSRAVRCGVFAVGLISFASLYPFFGHANPYDDIEHELKFIAFLPTNYKDSFNLNIFVKSYVKEGDGDVPMLCVNEWLYESSIGEYEDLFVQVVGFVAGEIRDRGHPTMFPLSEEATEVAMLCEDGARRVPLPVAVVRKNGERITLFNAQTGARVPAFLVDLYVPR